MSLPEADPAQLAQLSDLFLQTLDPARRRAAEQSLESLETQPNAHLSLLLVALVASPSAQAPVRLAAAIKLKNLCRRAWAVSSDGPGGEEVDDEAAAALIPQSDRDALKQQLMPLLFQLCSGPNAAPVGLRLQLSDSIALIADRDFPDRWPGLIDVLVQGLTQASPDSAALGAVLQTSHSIFRRWRSAFRSDELYTKINFVLERFAGPFLELLKTTDAALSNSKAPTADLSSNYLTLLQLLRDLSAQDLPPLFEDNLAAIFSLLLRWLNPTGSVTPIGGDGNALSPLYSTNSALSPHLEGDSDDAAPANGQKIRAEICSIAQLYAQRYLDAFGVCVPEYVKAVWEMLGVCGKGEKYDLLVSRAIAFLSTIVRLPSQRANFESDATLEAFVSAIILPNISLREADEEMFEDEPMEWIRREFAIETGGESDTRRHSASAFTKALLEQFPEKITSIISRYIGQYLSEAAADASGAKWRLKDTAVYLLTSIASTGTTSTHGASSMNSLVNVVDFFSQHVFGDLEAASGSGVHPILQVDAIKYLYTFRSQLTKEQLLSVLPLLVRHLESDNYVTCTYAAITIERVLFIKVDKKLLFSPTDVSAFAENILLACLRGIESGGTPEKMAENDYLMKCVMRVIFTSRQTLVPSHSAILQHLTHILVEISKNPSNPRFSQFCFESISALVRFVVEADASTLAAFEGALSTPFMSILQNDVAEFVPYVFQILSQMLELHAKSGAAAGTALPASYTSLLPSLLTPALWQSRGNVPALVRLLQAFLSAPGGAAGIAANNQLGSLLGIYQTLIASRINDEFGFALLQSLFENVEPKHLQQYRAAVLTLMLTRLQTSRTEKFARGFVTFFAGILCVQQQGYPDLAVEAFEAVQPGLFAQILQGVVLAELPKVQARNKRLVAVGLTRLLTSSQAMLRAPQVSAWPATLDGVLRLLLDQSLASSASKQAEEDEIFAQDWEEQGFQASFSVLTASQGVKRDSTAFAGPDVKAYVVGAIVDASRRQPGVIGPLVEQVPQETRSTLQALVSQQGQTIA